MPDILGGTQAMAQGVLATYTLGIAIGLVLWGEAGSRVNQVTLLLVCLCGFAIASLVATRADSIPVLTVCRFFQGLLGAAPAVFAPVWIRHLVPDHSVVRVFGLLATFESMIPALAPILGLWLLASFGWTSSFYLLFILALGTIVLLLIIRRAAPQLKIRGHAGTYRSLMRNLLYWRYSLSHAASLAGLLIFVFGMPAVMVHVFGLGVQRFIVMQITGIFFFAICANTAGFFTKRFGDERVILFGSVMSSVGIVLMIITRLSGVESVTAFIFLFIIVNAGFGLRAPPGFNQALAVSESNEARAAALLLLFAFVGTAVGTAITAPYVERGMMELLVTAFVVFTVSPVLLIALPPAKASSVPG
ncbi:MAG: MFS transporter [Pseudomonadota bacterium]